MTNETSSHHKQLLQQASVPLPVLLLGKVNVAEDVLKAIVRNGQSLFPFLGQHVVGNWGVVDEATRQSNIRAILHGFRIKSLYSLNDQTLIAIRTNSGRT